MAKAIPLRATLSIQGVKVVKSKFEILLESMCEGLPIKERGVWKFCREAVVCLSPAIQTQGNVVYVENDGGTRRRCLLQAYPFTCLDQFGCPCDSSRSKQV
jgi:hypothetical protein